MKLHRRNPLFALAIAALTVEVNAWPQNSAPTSPDEFMTKVLASIQDNDKPALQKLMVTEEEFKKYVWPRLPAVVRGSQSSPARYYKMFSESSNAGIEELLRQHGGQNLKFVKASFGHESDQKGSRVLASPVVTAVTGDGQQKTIRIASSVIEHDGTWKVANYFVAPASSSAKP